MQCVSDRAGTCRGGSHSPEGLFSPLIAVTSPTLYPRSYVPLGSTDTHAYTPRHTGTLTQRHAHSVEHKFSLSVSLAFTYIQTHTRAHKLSPSRFALPVSISCHLKSRTAGASGSRRGARLTGNGPHSLIRLPCSCPSSATPKMSSPGGRGLVECEEGEEVRCGERERERERPMGSLLPDSLKGALFQQERREESRGAVRGRLFKKGRAGPRRATLTLTRVTLLLPRQTAYYPTCREVIALAERKAVEVFKCFIWRQLKG